MRDSVAARCRHKRRWCRLSPLIFVNESNCSHLDKSPIFFIEARYDSTKHIFATLPSENLKNLSAILIKTSSPPGAGFLLILETLR